MPRIYVLSGPDVGRSFEVTSGATFGRAPECAVPLRDASVSRHHARLDESGGVWTVTDTQSRNGLRQDGARVPVVTLADGAEFSLGEVLIRFRADVAAATPVKEPEIAPPARTAPNPPPRASAGAADEIVLEGAWDETAFTPAPVRAPVSPTPVRATPPAQTARAQASEKLARAGALPKESPSARGILQFNRIEPQDGFMKSELGQQPLWIRALVVLVGLILFAAIFWSAFRGTSWLRGDPTPEAPAEESEPR